ncbi:MAG: nitrate- and nitrite sensing domain-containing protein [Sneathiella sp.]|nr:nitrate- and nitrite sensing domain-containing protein [Sneathiella sp.]
MQKILNRLGIGQRLIAIALIPLLFCLIFAEEYFQTSFSKVQQYQQLNQLLSITPKANDLIHELQKERGRSAGFIGSKGASAPKDALTNQRKSTDQKIGEYRDLIKGLDDPLILDRTKDIRENIETQLSELSAYRDRVDRLELTVPQMAKYYTTTINAGISFVDLIRHDSSDDYISKQLSAMLAITLAKEQAGLERAMGANGFSRGVFAPALFDRFMSLITKQTVYLSSFRTTAEPEAVQFLENTIKGPDVDEVQTMRNFVIESRGTIPENTYTGGYWFDKITTKINFYKQVEDFQKQKIESIISEKLSSATQSLWTRVVISLVGLALLTGAVFLILRSLSKPLNDIRRSLEAVSSGDVAADIPYQDLPNELGKMAIATEKFRASLIDGKAAEQAAKEAEAARQAEALKLEEQKKEAALQEARHKEEEEQLRIARLEKLQALAGQFEADLANSVQGLTDSISSLDSAGSNLDQVTDQTSERASSVRNLANTTSANMQSVASAIEELSSSISEISRQVSESGTVTKAAVDETAGAEEAMKLLSSSSGAISDMLTMINDIAEQTNLLALNATIEAARAGEAGKGFAVVASEVKSLASQTAKATGEIEELIINMKGANAQMEEAVGRISSSIEKSSEIVADISSSIGEQTTVTQEISTNVQRVNSDTRSVTDNASLMDEDAQKGKQAVQTVHACSSEIQKQRETLVNLAQEFTEKLKSA